MDPDTLLPYHCPSLDPQQVHLRAFFVKHDKWVMRPPYWFRRQKTERRQGWNQSSVRGCRIVTCRIITPMCPRPLWHLPGIPRGASHCNASLIPPSRHTPIIPPFLCDSSILEQPPHFSPSSSLRMKRRRWRKQRRGPNIFQTCTFRTEPFHVVRPRRLFSLRGGFKWNQHHTCCFKSSPTPMFTP